ncbi:hypothetical protein [Nocardioides conyzicola]|uniref:Uncharacterized protein n=1 Tax=Nocardioides conyzicola TaxID=1651781 RepID=A0ABP8WZE7_9ACTN
MSTETANLATLTAAASQFGVAFPKPVAALLSFEHNLPNLGKVQDEAVAELASAFGSTTYTRTLDNVLERLARAEAGSKIRRSADAALVRARWTSVMLHSEDIIKAFRAALSDDLGRLNTNAADVPSTSTATSSLQQRAYAARFAASNAAERLVSATRALAPLYGIGTSGGPGIETPTVQHRMMLTARPENLDRNAGLALARGLAGARLVSVGGDPTATDALWFAIAADLGATFRLVTPDEHRDTLALLRDAVRSPRLGEVLPPTLVL